MEASLDTETFSSEHGITLDAITDQTVGVAEADDLYGSPDHTALRKMVNRTFFRTNVAELEDRVRTLCRSYLDDFLGADGFDYVRDFSMKLPVMVISSLFGFPEKDHDNLREWSDAQLHRDDGAPQLSEDGQEANAKLLGYYADQIQQRRAAPTGDIVGNLMASDLLARWSEYPPPR